MKLFTRFLAILLALSLLPLACTALAEEPVTITIWGSDRENMPFRNGLMTIGMFYAVAHWNSYFSAVLYLNKAELYPLQIILRQVVLMNEIVENASSTENVMAEGIKYATIVVAMLPMLCVYPFVQRYFVKGVMIGSVKE